MLAAVSQNGRVLAYASKDLQADREVCVVVVVWRLLASVLAYTSSFEPAARDIREHEIVERPVSKINELDVFLSGCPVRRTLFLVGVVLWRDSFKSLGSKSLFLRQPGI